MTDTKTNLKNAFRAMKCLGIPADKVKPVLKNLLKVYDNSWSHIEAEHYRVLVDAIFESEEESAVELEHPDSSSDTQEEADPCIEGDNAENENEVEEEETEALVNPLKRSRILYEGQSSTLQACSNGETQALLVRPKEELSKLPEPSPHKLNELPEPIPHKLNDSSTLQTCNGESRAILLRHNQEQGELPEPHPRKINESLAVVQSLDSNAVVESPAGMSLGNRQGEQPKQMSSTTALIENNGKAMTEDMLLLEAPHAIFSPDFDSTIASLNAKHGAIDKDCNLSSNWIKNLSLFGICGLLKQLENKKLEELDISSLSPYYDIVQDAEKLNFHVKWLRERLDDIRVAVVARNKAKLLEDTKNVLLVERKQKLAKLRWHQIQVKETEDQLIVKNLEIEDLNEEINNETDKFRHFETMPLLYGLI